MKLTLRMMPPEAGDIFSQQVFASQVGKLIALEIGGETYYAEMVGAQVAPDGSDALVTLDITDEVNNALEGMTLTDWSFGFDADTN